MAARALGRIGTPAAAAAIVGALDGPRSVPADVAAMALVSIGPSAADVLVSALMASEPLGRIVACRVLGHLEILEAVDALEGTVGTDPDPALRAAAAAALGGIGSPRAVPSLLASVAAEPHEAVRVAAIAALGRIGDPTTVGAIEPLVGSSGYAVPHAAAMALASMGRRGRDALHRVALAGPPGALHAAESLALLDIRTGARRGPARSLG